MTINGPEFSNEKHGSAGLCSSKVSTKASNGLCFMIPGTSGHTTVWQNHGYNAGQEYRNAPTPIASMSKWSSSSYAACRGKNLSCSTTHATGCTDKSRGMSPVGDQTVAAVANDESLQVRVRKGTPPRREVNSAPFGAQCEVLRCCKK